MTRDVEQMIRRENVANKPKHWVRAVTACNSRCLFCLDSDTPRNLYLDGAEVRAEIDRGIDELGAQKIIISGGEASLHPEFAQFVRYARDRGYDRVQTVTNGFRFAERAFYDECMAAGLGEITFSLHGHTEALHDRLTQTQGAFRRLMKAMIRAVRDPRRPIVNVDIVINKQNVAVIDKIVELCIAAGVTEFDLLHVIPQAAAFEHRDELFYDVREHLPVLHDVFRLNRHPRFVVWTNRFPVSYLEGLEDLIQDPHKMLDEVNGRRFQVRRYIDEGRPLDCRDAQRCPHCFIEPFCTTMDRVIEKQNEQSFEVWAVGRDAWNEPLPFGCTTLGITVDDFDACASQATEAVRLYIETSSEAAPPKHIAERATLVAVTSGQLDVWFDSGAAIEVHLNRDTAAWLLTHRAAVNDALPRFTLHQPSYEHMRDAARHDVADPHAFFAELDLPIRASGLPPCLMPGAQHEPPRAILPKTVFDEATGRLSIRDLARYHVAERYLAKSVRCDDCALSKSCEGAHINFIRTHGLGALRPLATASRRYELPSRLADGRPPQPVATSLPGFPEPSAAPADPLAVAGELRDQQRALKRALPLLPNRS